MIQDFYKSCSLLSATQGTDSAGKIIYTWSTSTSITGVIIPNSKKINVDGVWQYKESPLFMTSDIISKDNRLLYDGKQYKFTSVPDNILSRDHHYEVNVEVIDV